MYIKIVLYLLSTTPTGFRGDHRDRAMRDLDVPPVESEHDHGEGDPDPCPEDEEYFVRPDAAEMEKAIGKFFDGLEGQERCGFQEMHSFLAKLPVPSTKESGGMTHTEAIAGQFLPTMDEEERKRFTPSELILYKPALEYRYIL